jgi:glycogen synthase
LRICLVSHQFPPDSARGGIGTQTSIKADVLTRLGHEVHVLSRGGSAGPELRTDEVCGVTLHRLRRPDSTVEVNEYETYWLGYSWEVFRHLRALEQKHSFDLIDFPEHWGEGYVYQLDRAPWAWTPVVVQLHCPLALLADRIGWPEAGSNVFRVGTHMEEMSIGLADGLMACSAHIANFASDQYGIPRETIDVVHCGVDLEMFRPDGGPNDGAPIVLFVGNVAASKGVVTVFEAVMMLRAKYPDVLLQILGPVDDDEVGTRLRRQAAELGAGANLEFLGFVEERASLPPHYRRASVLCAPSHHEGGVSNVYLEAMACGCPVIAADNGGTPEAVLDGQTGFLVPADDAEATAAALDRVLGDAQLRRRLGEQARRHVESYFGLEQYIGRVLTAYERTIDRSRGRLAALEKLG